MSYFFIHKQLMCFLLKKSYLDFVLTKIFLTKPQVNEKSGNFKLKQYCYLIWIIYYHIWILPVVPVTAFMTLFSPGHESKPGSLITFRWYELFFAFHDLDILKSTGQLFCRMAFYLCLSVSLGLGSDYSSISGMSEVILWYLQEITSGALYHVPLSH